MIFDYRRELPADHTADAVPDESTVPNLLLPRNVPNGTAMSEGLGLVLQSDDADATLSVTVYAVVEDMSGVMTSGSWAAPAGGNQFVALKTVTVEVGEMVVVEPLRPGQFHIVAGAASTTEDILLLGATL